MEKMVYLSKDSVPLEMQQKSKPSSLLSRNSVLKRQYFGSIDNLCGFDTKDEKERSLSVTDNNNTKRITRFRVEPGEDQTEDFQITSIAHLENPEYHMRWYFKYFLGQVHTNYIGIDNNKEPFALSVCLTGVENFHIPQYRAILWKRTGNQRISFPFTPTKPISPKNVLKLFSLSKIDKGVIKEIPSPDVQKEFVVLEEQEGSVNFKFGIIYAKQGQTTDDEMFANVHGSPTFERFLDLLGDTVRLKDWNCYRGGLDIKHDTTGTHSLYTTFQGHEIMFHVSLMLPFSNDSQQVERKRHIGNDIAVIVFVDGPIDEDIDFKPSMIRSKFTHVFAVVRHDKKKGLYRLSVYSEENVPVFGPPLPCSSIFDNAEDFRALLLTKLMNGEKAAYCSPVFSNKRQRTLDALLKGLQSDHLPVSTRKISLRKSFEQNKFARRYQGHKRSDQKRKAFVEVGQSLKVSKIMHGHAPTSLAHAGRTPSATFAPWDAECVIEDFGMPVICGDSLGDGLILSTPFGLYYVQGGDFQQVFDQSCVAKQLTVVESYGLVIFITDKDPRLYVVPVSEFEQKRHYSKARKDLTQYRLSRSKGCHLFTVSSPSSNPFCLAYCVNRRVTLLRWDYNLLIHTNSAYSSLVDGFSPEWDTFVSDVPTLATIIVDGSRTLNICVGQRDRFDLINRVTREIKTIHKISNGKHPRLISAVDTMDTDNPELLLSYNNHSIFRKLNRNTEDLVKFHWNSVPFTTVCAFPYVLAFTQNSIEVRLIVNGNLVHTSLYPKLVFISAKYDIYFSSIKVMSSTKSEAIVRDRSHSVDDGLHTLNRPHAVYKLSLNALVGTSRDVIESQLSNMQRVLSSPVFPSSSDDFHDASPRPTLTIGDKNLRTYSEVAAMKQQVILREKKHVSTTTHQQRSVSCYSTLPIPNQHRNNAVRAERSITSMTLERNSRILKRISIVSTDGRPQVSLRLDDTHDNTKHGEMTMV